MWCHSLGTRHILFGIYSLSACSFILLDSATRRSILWVISPQSGDGFKAEFSSDLAMLESESAHSMWKIDLYFSLPEADCEQDD